LRQGGEAAHATFVQDVFSAWLHAPNLHGCAFATWAAKNDRLRYASFFDPPDEAVIRQLSLHIRVAQSQEQLALAVLPSIETEQQLRSLIELLGRDPQWNVIRLPIPDRFALDLRWKASESLEASAIGFAPLGTMPVTRRSPYVALGVWAGGHGNPRRKKPDTFMGVGDMSHGLQDERYDKMQRLTRERVSRARNVLKDPAVATGVTFCLSGQSSSQQSSG
jgi:hypothetical protein